MDVEIKRLWRLWGLWETERVRFLTGYLHGFQRQTFWLLWMGVAFVIMSLVTMTEPGIANPLAALGLIILLIWFMYTAYMWLWGYDHHIAWRERTGKWM